MYLYINKIYIVYCVIVHGMMISFDWNRLETCYETVRWLTALIIIGHNCSCRWITLGFIHDYLW